MTIEQKQCLLRYLGYYTGHIDGIWGSGSQAATIAFQRSQGLTVDGLFSGETEAAIRKAVAEDFDWWANIHHFRREEFACKCCRYCDGYPAEIQRALVELAEDARNHFGAPATVVSGVRCKRHNANVGGVANSQHMYGEAVDLRIEGVSADRLLAYIQSRPGVRYAYKINDTNIHFDIPKGKR